ncbi:MAG TPA: hypothetical protein VH796_02620 [Nitrososphaeraceae archaeon]|jgi:hypothetical protein
MKQSISSDKLSIQLQPADYQSEQLAKYPKKYLVEIIKNLEQRYVIKQVRKATQDSSTRASKYSNIAANKREGEPGNIPS